MSHHLMTPGEVARLFRVNPKTVAKWANRGLLGRVIKTPGKHRRFDKEYVEKLYDEFQNR